MNPRIGWIAREVLPTLYSIAVGRGAREKELRDAARAAIKKADDAEEQCRRAARALGELRNLLLAGGYTSDELDTLALGSRAPTDAPPLCETCESEVPL